MIAVSWELRFGKSEPQGGKREPGLKATVVAARRSSRPNFWMARSDLDGRSMRLWGLAPA